MNTCPDLTPPNAAKILLERELDSREMCLKEALDVHYRQHEYIKTLQAAIRDIELVLGKI